MLFLWLDLENRFNAFRFYFTFRADLADVLGLVDPARRLPGRPCCSPGPRRPADLRERWRDSTASGVRSRPARRLGARTRAGARRRSTSCSARHSACTPVSCSGRSQPVRCGTRPYSARCSWCPVCRTGAAFMLLYRLDGRERELLGGRDMGAHRGRAAPPGPVDDRPGGGRRGLAGRSRTLLGRPLHGGLLDAGRGSRAAHPAGRRVDRAQTRRDPGRFDRRAGARGRPRAALGHRVRGPARRLGQCSSAS